MYADGHVTVVFVLEMMHTCSDLKRNSGRKLRSLYRPFRRKITGSVLNVSFSPELEQKMVFVYARKDDAAVVGF